MIGCHYDEPDTTSAWIDPEGRWYHVEDCAHEETARIMGHLDAYSLEREGWMHLSWTSPYTLTGPTEAQVRTLEALASVYEAKARRTRDAWDQAEYDENAKYIRQYVADYRNDQEALERRRASAEAFYGVMREAARTYNYRREGD
jgi:hypothetical protein